MKRIILAIALTTATLIAQSPYALVPDGKGSKTAISVASIVYVTAHGKVYHTHADCMSLAKSKPLQTTAELATSHGLTICKVCQHRDATSSKSTTKKTFDNSWVK